ncbi:LOG family protein [Glacieibacterium frigidum]|uniref:Cytokinin riboside 5'-monophosphate phosphoribohydrolase n=1 Tax=Glacieibacterium frigidum TaxID=2593303 RepID=A0A552U7F7_9SPHN|nr:TIGR00730 family Rossman fold protein [Glacieibacterium frigidum]TRW14148.1 TIGR00730 family Rossman fold protein [Glacieibacterium frigidum]
MHPNLPDRLFPTARDEAAVANKPTSVPQTEHPAYELAFQDKDFLLTDEMRPVRLQLEMAKCDLALAAAGIKSMFVFYGSARIPAPEDAQALIDAAKTDAERAVATRLAANAKYYDIARSLARLVSGEGEDQRWFTVCSGGGPSIMEAANRGAADVGAPSVGLNIVLPFEQVPNPYVTPGLSFQFHYFALRKMHFLMRARAVAVFPGGFGTLDEFMELLTLVQTGKISPLPILLYGREFWGRIVNFEALADEGVIARGDLDLFHTVDTAEEGWAIVRKHYEI